MLFWRSGQQRSVATMRLRSGTRETRLKTQLRQSLLVLHEVFAEARRSKGRLWHAAQDAEEGTESRCRKSGYLDRNQTCRADRSGLRRHVSQADRRGIARVDSASDSPACRQIVHHSPGLRSRQGRMNAVAQPAARQRYAGVLAGIPFFQLVKHCLANNALAFDKTGHRPSLIHSCRFFQMTKRSLHTM